MSESSQDNRPSVEEGTEEEYNEGTEGYDNMSVEEYNEGTEEEYDEGTEDECDEESGSELFYENACSDSYRPDYLTHDVLDMSCYDTIIKHSIKPDKITFTIYFNQGNIPNHLASVIQGVPDAYDSPFYQYTLTVSLLFPYGYRVSNIDLGVEITNFNKIHFQLNDLIRKAISEEQSSKYSKNLIEVIYKKILNFLPNVNQYCISCMNPFEYDPPIPTFCNRHLCLYQMINLGLTDLYNELLHYSIESDLKISLCHSALTSHRRDIIFGEIPVELQEANPNIAYDNMLRLLGLLPSVQDMLQLTNSNKELRKLLNDIDDQLYYFLTWIILSCQNYIKDVSSEILNGEDKHFPKDLITEKLNTDDNNTTHKASFTNNIKRVFKIISDSPEREIKFQKKELSPDYNLELVYHGTSTENLHNILHNSLENCSGTKKQTCGAAHGSGVYLGKNLQTSLGYTRSGNLWDKSNITTQSIYSCCILVKFAKPNDTSLYKDVGFYVVPDSTLLQNRYLLIM